MDVRIVISGLGRVGRAFVGLLLQKDKDLKERYGLRLKVVAAVDIGGAAVSPEGLPLTDLLAHLEKGGRVEDRISCGRKGFTSGEAIGTGQKAQKKSGTRNTQQGAWF